ncbi:Protein transport protein SEC31 [Leucoagaricus sp. SymC.cos]|nr:Protein transport protein SEC31 [Leucoagaricus sp. SymC.cos]
MSRETSFTGSVSYKNDRKLALKTLAVAAAHNDIHSVLIGVVLMTYHGSVLLLSGCQQVGYSGWISRTSRQDLRGKREIVALAYGGGAGTFAGQIAAGGGLAVGGRRGMSDTASYPDNATRLVTAFEDDSSPIIMVWDLRNVCAPEKILTGRDKDVLSLSWCKQDVGLLSCGKDNRALCWNPQTSEITGELPSHDNWAFQVDWCPRIPDLLVTPCCHGTIGIHSIRSTSEPSTAAGRPAVPKADGSDIFDAPALFSSFLQWYTIAQATP